MQSLIWIGAALSLMGIGGLVYCIVTALRARPIAVPDLALVSRTRVKGGAALLSETFLAFHRTRFVNP